MPADPPSDGAPIAVSPRGKRELTTGCLAISLVTAGSLCVALSLGVLLAIRHEFVQATLNLEDLTTAIAWLFCTWAVCFCSHRSAVRIGLFLAAGLGARFAILSWIGLWLISHGRFHADIATQAYRFGSTDATSGLAGLAAVVLLISGLLLRLVLIRMGRTIRSSLRDAAFNAKGV